jgi:hypothetical protein
MPIAALWCRYGKYRARPNDAAIIPAALRMTLLLATCLFEFPKVQLTTYPFDPPNGCNMGVLPCRASLPLSRKPVETVAVASSTSHRGFYR